MAIEEIIADTAYVSMNEYGQITEAIIKNLRKFGLTQNESKIYVYLGKNGPKKAIEISRQQKIPRTETYHLLSTLQKKGIVSSRFEKPTKFEGLSFEKAISVLITNEQKRIDDLQMIKRELIDLWELIPSSKNLTEDSTFVFQSQEPQLFQTKNILRDVMKDDRV